MSLETDVADHYTTGSLTDRIMAALAQLGVNTKSLAPNDLKPVDEFHTGGLEATTHLLSQVEISPGAKTLDIGCGIGGTARHLATHFKAQVDGIDLTPEYVATANELSDKVNLAEQTRFHVASALDLPGSLNSFDLVTMFHVGMNISDKATLFANVARALRPGGRFAVFDVMKKGNAPLAFPVPWSSVPDTSFVDSSTLYTEAAKSAGLSLQVETDRTQFAKDFFARIAAKIAADGPPPLGIHLLMGDTAGQKIENYLTGLHDARLAPTEMIFAKA